MDGATDRRLLTGVKDENFIAFLFFGAGADVDAAALGDLLLHHTFGVVVVGQEQTVQLFGRVVAKCLHCIVAFLLSPGKTDRETDQTDQSQSHA